MLNAKQGAIIKKDITGIVSNRQLFPVLLLIPAVFALVLPTLFIVMAYYGGDGLSDLQQIVDMLGVSGQLGNNPILLIEVLLNYIMPMFFLIIPIMAAMVMAASSFVGEKENRTLETLLYSPLSLKEIFHAKILASFLLSMLISAGSFLFMLLVVEAEIMLLFGRLYLPNLNWLITMLLVSPAISLISIILIVRGSAKARTMQESQQRAVFLILPVIMLAAGQFTGIFLVGPGALLCFGALFALLAALLMKGAIGKFTYEALLA